LIRKTQSGCHTRIESCADELKRWFVEDMESLKVGDPMDEAADISPLATADILAYSEY
jgi:acyl-CoA reductase-like NAD-dependent aldehyde dehydrogenase